MALDMELENKKSKLMDKAKALIYNADAEKITEIEKALDFDLESAENKIFHILQDGRGRDISNHDMTQQIIKALGHKAVKG